MPTGDIIITNNWGATTSDRTDLFEPLQAEWVPGGAGVITNGTVITRNITLQPRQRPPAVTLPEEAETLITQARANLGTARPKPWYRIENAASPTTAEVWIYDEISPYGVAADQFVKDIAGIKAKSITVHMNTPGGLVFDGIAMANALRAHPANITVRVEGIAASIGSLIAMAGDRVVMLPQSMMMIHEAAGLTIGDAEDHRKQAEVLDFLSNQIAAAYADRTDGDVKAWRSRMAAETWISETQAVELGLADEILVGSFAARNTFDLSRFRNVPADLAAGTVPPEDADPTPTKRQLEDALRDAGLSAAKAKAMVSAGYRALESRDEPESAVDPDETTAPGVSESDEEVTGMVTPETERQRVADFIAHRDREFALTG